MDTPRTRLSLDGEWILTTDPDDRGLAERWFDRFPPGAAMTVTVPSVWDIWIPDYDGAGWYEHEFDLAGGAGPGCALLRFAAVNYVAEVWVNGVRLGKHEGGYTPFELDATAAITPGRNRVTVRVIDPKNRDGYGPYRPEELPIAKEMGYWSFGGIWGGVSLLLLPPARITNVFIKPVLAGRRVDVRVEVDGAPRDTRVRLTVEDTPFACTGAPGEISLEMPEFAPWSPESPVLYRLRAELLSGEAVLDAVTTRFGMREFTVRGDRFVLNGEPIFLKGVLYQPDYARTLAAPASPQDARRELELAREAGFNMVRVHIKPAPEIILELADEIGLLIYEEPSIGWIRASEYMRQRCEASVREMILRDRNHPSIVIWGMLNETGNHGYVFEGGAQTIKDDLCRLARSLDPTRVVIDDSAGVNATREASRFMLPYSDRFVEFDDLHIYQRAPVDRVIRDYYLQAGDPGLLSTVSEFGFGAPEDLADVLERYGEQRTHLKDARFLQRMLDACNEGFRDRGLHELFGDFGGFSRAALALQCEAARRQIDAMRANPKLAGYCYTQLADAGHEFCAGMLDRWRRPKPVVAELAEAQRPVRPLIMMDRTNLPPGGSSAVSVVMANESGRTGRAEYIMEIIAPDGRSFRREALSVPIPGDREQLWSGKIAAPEEPGEYRFCVRLMDGGVCVAESHHVFHVFTPAEPVDREVHVIDPEGTVTERIGLLARPAGPQAALHIVPPIANRIGAYPADAMAGLLARVQAGATALFFCPPKDWNELAALIGHDLCATPKDAVGGFLPAFHYVKSHPVFDGLPSHGLMGMAYHNVIPARTFLEASDEDICGTYDATPVAAGNYMDGQTAWWGSDVLVRCYGTGRIVLTHMRVLDHLGADPVADRIFTNMVRYFHPARAESADVGATTERGAPAGPGVARDRDGAAEPAPDERIAQFLHSQRSGAVHRWMIAGEFPNWGETGFDTAYPPESVRDFGAVYSGWYQPAAWREWFTHASEHHLLDFQAVFEPVFQWYPRFDRAVAYAYTEIGCERTMTVTMTLGIQNDTRVWVNGVPVYETRRQVPHDRFDSDAVQATLREGTNTVLVKCAKTPGPFRFSLDVEEPGPPQPRLRWW